MRKSYWTKTPRVKITYSLTAPDAQMYFRLHLETQRSLN